MFAPCAANSTASPLRWRSMGQRVQNSSRETRMTHTQFLALLLLAISTVTLTNAAASDAAKGKEIYDQLCWRCHGRLGKSDGPVSSAMDPRPRDLTEQAYMGKISDDELLVVVKAGGAAVGKSPAMMAFKDTLSDDEIRDVIAFIRTLCCR
jgi:cytochrome c oxidase cbb3-type subunit III